MVTHHHLHSGCPLVRPVGGPLDPRWQDPEDTLCVPDPLGVRPYMARTKLRCIQSDEQGREDLVMVSSRCQAAFQGLAICVAVHDIGEGTQSYQAFEGPQKNRFIATPFLD